MGDVYDLKLPSISCFALNNKCTTLVASPSNKEIRVYKLAGKKWDLVETLFQHTQTVTRLSWYPNGEKFLSCSSDRNAFVWSLENGKWVPQLVVLGIKFSACCGSVSPKGQKLGVGCSDKLVSVCFYRKSDNWYTGRRIKKPILSTVTCLDWHPDEVLLACGSTDSRVRVFSTFTKDLDPASAEGECGKFGELYLQTKSMFCGFINDVKFSPSGRFLAFAAHDSTLSVIDMSSKNIVATLNLSTLPLKCIMWTREQALVGGGFDFIPFTFEFSNGKLTKAKELDKPKAVQSSGQSAMSKFKNLDRTALEEDVVTSTTVHGNTIIDIKRFDGSADNVKKVAAISIEGRFAVWAV